VFQVAPFVVTDSRVFQKGVVSIKQRSMLVAGGSVESGLLLLRGFWIQQIMHVKESVLDL